jgi:cold shock CspA family protein
MHIGEFGFVKPVDRSEVIYFKVDDVIDQDIRISEGMEVDFFVIVENSKGKMSDRAVHLQILPPGTVQFEITVAENVEAMVIGEARVGGEKMYSIYNSFIHDLCI